MNDKETLEEIKEEKSNFKKIINGKKLDLFELDNIMLESEA